jgi:hypothetical protein
MQAATGKLVTGGVEAEAQEVMKNLKAGEPIAFVHIFSALFSRRRYCLIIELYICLFNSGGSLWL